MQSLEVAVEEADNLLYQAKKRTSTYNFENLTDDKHPFSLYKKLVELAQEPLSSYDSILPEDQRNSVFRSPSLIEKLVYKENLNTLVVNLYPADKGFSLSFRNNYSETTGNHFDNNSFATMNISISEQELLHFLDLEEIPPVFSDMLPNIEPSVFYGGCIIAEIRNYREYVNLEHYHVTYILLKPSIQGIINDSYVTQLRHKEWKTKDRLQFESTVILANSGPLCLSPNPSVGIAMRKLNRLKNALNRPKLKSVVQKYTPLGVAISKNNAQHENCSVMSTNLAAYISTKKPLIPRRTTKIALPPCPATDDGFWRCTTNNILKFAQTVPSKLESGGVCGLRLLERFEIADREKHPPGTYKLAIYYGDSDYDFIGLVTFVCDSDKNKPLSSAHSFVMPTVTAKQKFVIGFINKFRADGKIIQITHVKRKDTVVYFTTGLRYVVDEIVPIDGKILRKKDSLVNWKDFHKGGSIRMKYNNYNGADTNNLLDFNKNDSFLIKDNYNVAEIEKNIFQNFEYEEIMVRPLSQPTTSQIPEQKPQIQFLTMQQQQQQQSNVSQPKQQSSKLKPIRSMVQPKNAAIAIPITNNTTDRAPNRVVTVNGLLSQKIPQYSSVLNKPDICITTSTKVLHRFPMNTSTSSMKSNPQHTSVENPEFNYNNDLASINKPQNTTIMNLLSNTSAANQPNGCTASTTSAATTITLSNLLTTSNQYLANKNNIAINKTNISEYVSKQSTINQGRLINLINPAQIQAQNPNISLLNHCSQLQTSNNGGNRILPVQIKISTASSPTVVGIRQQQTIAPQSIVLSNTNSNNTNLIPPNIKISSRRNTAITTSSSIDTVPVMTAITTIAGAPPTILTTATSMAGITSGNPSQPLIRVSVGSINGPPSSTNNMNSIKFPRTISGHHISSNFNKITFKEVLSPVISNSNNNNHPINTDNNSIQDGLPEDVICAIIDHSNTSSVIDSIDSIINNNSNIISSSSLPISNVRIRANKRNISSAVGINSYERPSAMMVNASGATMDSGGNRSSIRVDSIPDELTASEIQALFGTPVNPVQGSTIHQTAETTGIGMQMQEVGLRRMINNNNHHQSGIGSQQPDNNNLYLSSNGDCVPNKIQKLMKFSPANNQQPTIYASGPPSSFSSLLTVGSVNDGLLGRLGGVPNSSQQFASQLSQNQFQCSASSSNNAGVVNIAAAQNLDLSQLPNSIGTPVILTSSNKSEKFKFTTVRCLSKPARTAVHVVNSGRNANKMATQLSSVHGTTGTSFSCRMVTVPPNAVVQQTSDGRTQLIPLNSHSQSFVSKVKPSHVSVSGNNNHNITKIDSVMRSIESSNQATPLLQLANSENLEIQIVSVSTSPGQTQTNKKLPETADP